MYFRVLGPIELWNEGRQFTAGTLKERHVLAILLFEAGRVVSAATIAERIWDDRPPVHARETLQAYVSRLRGRLKAAGGHPDLISNSAAGGYRLEIPAEQVDLRRFDELVLRARAAAGKPDAELARALLREAEDLWRGEALGGVAGLWADAIRQALEERRRNATLTRIELDLRLGGHADDLISELIALTGAGSIDQGAVGLLMRALSDAGRQDEALAAYRRVQRRLRDELGTDPRTELQSLHQRILHGESGLITGRSMQLALAAPAPAPDTIERDPLHLVGRETELHDVLSAIEQDLRTVSGVTLYALDGMPGVGKSTLAIRAAHRLRSHCPDGVLQLNLRTHHPHQQPLEPREALTQLLEDLATPAAELQRAATVDALAALWRRRSSGRRLLLLLDDVTSAQQITALLPATQGSIVLITSRHRLTGLGDARHHTVRLLSDEAAQSLLERITERTFPEQSEDLARYMRRCAGLPLVINVTAAHLRAHPQWTLRDLLERLDATPTGDSLTEPIHTAFAMSYQALPELERTLLRRLAAHPGQEIEVHAAAALVDTDLQRTGLAADNLVERNLLEEIERHRYRLHDLMRDFASGRIQHERDEAATWKATDRALDFYLATAIRAERTLRPHRRAIELPANSSPSVPLPAVESTEDAQRWFDREGDNLTALAVHAREHQHPQHSALLPLVLAQHLDRRGYWRSSTDILQHALDTEATRGAQPDGVVMAQIMTDLAAALLRIGQLDTALSLASAALDAWTTREDRRGQADALLEIGRAHWYARRLTAADDAYHRSSRLYDEIGDRRSRTAADDHRNIVQFELGNIEAAIRTGEHLVQTAQELGDRALECDVLTNLGEMYRLGGRFEQALEYFLAARPLAQRLADPHNLAVLANNIGAVYERLGNLSAALDSFGDALHLFQALDDGRNLVDTLAHLTDAQLRAGRHDQAAAHLRQGATVAAQLRDPLRHARVHLATGRLHRARNDHREAADSFRTALTFAQRAAALLEQARALHALGDLLDAEGDHPAAREHWRRAAELYRQLDHPDVDLIPS